MGCYYHTRMSVIMSDPGDRPCKEAHRIIAQILVVSNQCVIRQGYSPLMHCSVQSAACRIEHIIAKIDKRKGEVIEHDPESLVINDAALVEIVPENSDITMETFEECPALGRIVLRD